MNPDTKANPETNPADTQTTDSEKNALSPRELGEIAGGRSSNDPCEGEQLR
jgi:hypothetical protein